MSLTVTPVRGRRALREWIDVPWRVYRDVPDSRWIPPLRLMVRELVDTRKNPFYLNADRELFLALRDGRPVGRIAAIENRAHNAHHGDRVGFFGFFECEEDPGAAAVLLDAASEWLEARGLTSMRGPVNPSTNGEVGILVRGFRWEPFLLTAWTPRYYPALLEGAGMGKAKDVLAYFLPTDPERFRLPETVLGAAERAQRREGLVFRDLDLARLGDEAEQVRLIYNEAWAGNWGFVPMSREEFAYMARELKPLLLPQFSFVAEVDDEPAGFMVVVPDFNQAFKRIPSGRLLPTGIFTLLLAKRRLRTGRIILLGVRDRFRRHRSIFPLFAAELLRRARGYGALGAEASWVLEDNDALNRPLLAMGAKVTKRWRLYERPVGRAREGGRRTVGGAPAPGEPAPRGP